MFAVSHLLSLKFFLQQVDSVVRATFGWSLLVVVCREYCLLLLYVLEQSGADTGKVETKQAACLRCVAVHGCRLVLSLSTFLTSNSTAVLFSSFWNL